MQLSKPKGPNCVPCWQGRVIRESALGGKSRDRRGRGKPLRRAGGRGHGPAAAQPAAPRESAAPKKRRHWLQRVDERSHLPPRPQLLAPPGATAADTARLAPSRAPPGASPLGPGLGLLLLPLHLLRVLQLHALLRQLSLHGLQLRRGPGQQHRHRVLGEGRDTSATSSDRQAPAPPVRPLLAAGGRPRLLSPGKKCTPVSSAGFLEPKGHVEKQPMCHSQPGACSC